MIARSELEEVVCEMLDAYEVDADGLAEDLIERLLQDFPESIYDDFEEDETEE